MSVETGDRWWDHALCAGRDPAWWSDDRRMWPAAVKLCLSCPVREICLREAIAQRDNGVIRAGMLLADTSRGYTVVPLICANCGLRPVRLTLSGGVPRYCGRTCQMASRQAGHAAAVTAGLAAGGLPAGGVPASSVPAGAPELVSAAGQVARR